jgi:hypothetical protein
VVTIVGKISVSIRVPAVGQTHDFLIPANMAVRDVVALTVNILVSEYGISDSVSDVSLFDGSDGKVLKSDCSFFQLGISDGAELILV